MRYAIVLAAGRGERLWPLTYTRPKPLLPLPRGTLLSRILRQLQGLVDGAVVVASRETLRPVESYLSGWSPGYPVSIAVQEEARGTADAVRTGLEALPHGVDELLIVYSDIYIDTESLRRLVETGQPALLAAVVKDPSRYGVLVAREGCLERIVEKPSKPVSNLVNAGAYILDREAVEEAVYKTGVSPRGEYEFTDTVSTIARGTCVRIVEAKLWLDVGTPWDLLRAVEIELRHMEPRVEGEVEPGATLRGPVYVSRKAVVRTGTVVEGPAWIEGEVGPLAHVRPYTLILEGAKVGAFTQVKASILMEDARAPHLNYVGDSVVGEGANLGAGSITANLRFDHATVKVRLKGRLVDTGRRKLGAVIGGYAQLGINANTMPGVRVGAYSWVEAGLTLYRDVPDCSFARRAGDGVAVEPLDGRGVECRPMVTVPERY